MVEGDSKDLHPTRLIMNNQYGQVVVKDFFWGFDLKCFYLIQSCSCTDLPPTCTSSLELVFNFEHHVTSYPRGAVCFTVVSISGFLSILCCFLYSGTYYSIISCFPFYSSVLKYHDLSSRTSGSFT